MSDTNTTLTHVNCDYIELCHFLKLLVYIDVVSGVHVRMITHSMKFENTNKWKIEKK